MQNQQPLQGLNQTVLGLLLSPLMPHSDARAAQAETLQSCLTLLLHLLLTLPVSARHCLGCTAAFPNDTITPRQLT